jgi:hypothetical protein
VEVGDPELFYGIHHLRPLTLPGLPLAVEIHHTPKWPHGLQRPPADEIVSSAVDTRLGVEGILAPEPAHHALLVASHGWAHAPLLRLRDLVDVAVLAAEVDEAAVEAVARRWGLQRLWRTTSAAACAVLLERPKPLSARIWARHLEQVRERTVLEAHLTDLLAGFWILPFPAAAAQMLSALATDLRPAPEESWRPKLARSLKAFWNARTPLSQHNQTLGDEATRGQRRNPPDARPPVDATHGDRHVDADER